MGYGLLCCAWWETTRSTVEPAKSVRAGGDWSCRVTNRRVLTRSVVVNECVQVRCWSR